jgi:hypothetical protein
MSNEAKSNKLTTLTALLHDARLRLSHLEFAASLGNADESALQRTRNEATELRRRCEEESAN